MGKDVWWMRMGGGWWDRRDRIFRDFRHMSYRIILFVVRELVQGWGVVCGGVCMIRLIHQNIL